MKKFNATITDRNDNTENVTLCVNHHGKFADVTVNFIDREITVPVVYRQALLTLSDCVNNEDYSTQDTLSFSNPKSAKTRHSIQVISHYFPSLGLILLFEERWSEGWEDFRRSFDIVLEKEVANSFLQYLIDGFTK